MDPNIKEYFQICIIVLLRIFRGWEIETQKIAITIYISFKNLLTKNHLIYTYYINLVEAIISHQKLRPTCRKMRSSCTGFKNDRKLSTLA